MHGEWGVGLSRVWVYVRVLIYESIGICESMGIGEGMNIVRVWVYVNPSRPLTGHGEQLMVGTYSK